MGRSGRGPGDGDNFLETGGKRDGMRNCGRTDRVGADWTVKKKNLEMAWLAAKSSTYTLL